MATNPPYNAEQATIRAFDPNGNKFRTSAEFFPTGLFTAVKITNMTVSDFAGKIPAAPLSDRNSMIIWNRDVSQSIYIGNIDVTATGVNQGWEIGPDSYFAIDIKDDIEIYAICPSGGSAAAKVMELA